MPCLPIPLWEASLELYLNHSVEKAKKQEVEAPTGSLQQLLLVLLDVTLKVPFYRPRS